jgi:HEAT repeat protein
MRRTFPSRSRFPGIFLALFLAILAPAIALAQEKDVSTEIDRLTEILESGDAQTRVNAIKELGRIGLAAVPALIKALKDDEDGVRSSAAEALGGIGPAAAEAIQVLRDLKNYADPMVGRTASNALNKIEV